MSVALLTRRYGEMQTRLKSPDPRAIVSPSSYDAEARTVEATVATENPIERWGVNEVLVITKAAVDLTRTAKGRMAFLNNHDPNRPIGNVVKVSIEAGQLVAVLRFADTPEGRKAEGQVARGELSQFSIGYRVRKWDERHSPSGIDTVRAVEWEIYEVSLVSIPADKAAVVRSLKGPQSMDPEDEIVVDQIEDINTPPARDNPSPQTRAERVRIRTITDVAGRAGMNQASIDQAISDGTTVEEFRHAAQNFLAARPGQGPLILNSQVYGDEGDARIRDMSLELRRRMAGENRPRAASAQRYYDMSLVEMAAESIGHRGRIPTRAGEREEILRRAFHATSDFPNMLETATGARIAERYAAAAPTFRRLTWRRDVADFRPAPIYRTGDFPNLEEVIEGAEIKYGTFSDRNREVLTIASYAKGIGFSRHLLVNDQLDLIEDVLKDYTTRVVAFEENLFWRLMLSANKAGPTLLSTTRPIFNTTDGSLAAAGGALTAATVGAGRAAMRKHKSLDGLFVQSEPKLLVVGPDMETAADTFLATVVPNEIGKANPFAGTLTKVVTPEIPDNSWYLFADPASVPAFAYSLLEGYQAPRLTFKSPFDSQGLQAKVEHDVGFSALDFRGAYRNPGPA